MAQHVVMQVDVVGQLHVLLAHHQQVVDQLVHLLVVLAVGEPELLFGILVINIPVKVLVNEVVDMK